MKKLLHALLILFFFLATEAMAQHQATPTRSIGEFLDENGQFQNPERYKGSLGTDGFTLDLAEDGTPVFLPAATVSNPDNEYWTLESSISGFNDHVTALAAVGDDLFVGGRFTYLGDIPFQYIVRYNRTDGSWHALGDGVSSSVSSLAVVGDDLYVGGAFRQAGDTPANHIARYDMSDGSWHALGVGVNNQVNTLAVTGNTMYVGGLFTLAGGKPAAYLGRWEGLSSTDAIAARFLPEQLTLMQNYPNPFNPGTQIRFAVADNVHVTLSVYNILGQKIATLVNGSLPSGWHEVTFHADGLSSGVFIYRIKAGNYVDARRMVFVK